MSTKYDLSALTERVRGRLSQKRFEHTMGVFRASLRLAELCGEDSELLSVASLLHDISKEYSREEQLVFLDKLGIVLDGDDKSSPQIWHSYTARYIICRDFPEFANERVLKAIDRHTVGAPDMTVFEKILFLADFIEDTRTYKASESVREYVYSNMKQGQVSENRKILTSAVIRSIDYTISRLTSEKRQINTKTLLTKNALLSKI